MSDATSSGGGGSGLGRGLGMLALLLILLVAVASLVRGVASVAPQDVAQATATPGMHCPTQTPSGLPVFIVRLSMAKYPETTAHVNDARTLQGKPYILTIDRPGKDKRSAEALAGWPTKAGYDRDEYPPAVALEGGRGADVRYVKPSDNSGARASMGNQLRPQSNGAKFCIDLVP